MSIRSCIGAYAFGSPVPAQMFTVYIMGGFSIVVGSKTVCQQHNENAPHRSLSGGVGAHIRETR